MRGRVSTANLLAKGSPMSSASVEFPPHSAGLNSAAEIGKRVANGTISWIGPALLVTARTALLLLCQGLLALILFVRHHSVPWREAGDWWAVYGTLVDIGCLIGMRHFTRREGIRLRDLFGPIRMRWGRDVWLGLGFFLLIFPFFLAGSYAARLLLFGATDATVNAHLLRLHALPLWATIYSLSIWWMIWSPTEEMTYQAYALPRFEALSGRTWIAFLIVGFWWAAQHCALPFVPEWKFILFRFLAFLPGVLVAMLVYLRSGRRLAPLIVAHWPMDIAAASITALWS